MRRLAGVGHMEMFGLDLTHALFALRPRVAARGRVGVFGVEQQIAPQTPQSLERRRPFGLLERGERGQLLDRQREAFGLPVESCVLRVGADAVLPIGSKVAADGLELVSELLLDRLEIVAERDGIQVGSSDVCSSDLRAAYCASAPMPSSQ